MPRNERDLCKWLQTRWAASQAHWWAWDAVNLWWLVNVVWLQLLHPPQHSNWKINCDTHAEMSDAALDSGHLPRGWVLCVVSADGLCCSDNYKHGNWVNPKSDTSWIQTSNLTLGQWCFRPPSYSVVVKLWLQTTEGFELIRVSRLQPHSSKF
jgi:hypothetical protein